MIVDFIFSFILIVHHVLCYFQSLSGFFYMKNLIKKVSSNRFLILCMRCQRFFIQSSLDQVQTYAGYFNVMLVAAVEFSFLKFQYFNHFFYNF